VVGSVRQRQGYLGDIGITIQNNLLSGPQWNIYDVYMQGNNEGKIGFDALGLIVGAPELSALSSSAGRAALTAAGKQVDDLAEAAFRNAQGLE